MRRIPFLAFVLGAIPAGIALHIGIALVLITLCSGIADGFQAQLLRFGPSALLLVIGLFFVDSGQGRSPVRALRIAIAIVLSALPVAILSAYPVILVVWCLIAGDCI